MSKASNTLDSKASNANVSNASNFQGSKHSVTQTFSMVHKNEDIFQPGSGWMIIEHFKRLIGVKKLNSFRTIKSPLR